MNSFNLSIKKAFLILILILALGFFLRIWKIGQQSFIADEYIGINTSYGFFKTGEWKYWDFNKNEISDRGYTRGKIYFWQVAESFHFLSVNEKNARMVSVGWGMISLLLVFLISYYFTKKTSISLLASLLAAVSISLLTYDRKLRMYAMFVPVYLDLSWSVFMLLESKASRGMKKINELSSRMGLNLNYLPLCILLFSISAVTHFLTINIFPVISVYLLIVGIVEWKSAGSWKNKYIIYFLLSLFLISISLLHPEMREAFNFIGFWVNNWGYFDKVVLDYSHPLLALLFFFLGVFYLIKKDFKKGLWVALSFLVLFFLAVMVWTRSAGHQYILFAQPFKIIIVASGIYFFAKEISEKFFKKSRGAFVGIVIFLFLLLINFSFFFSKESFYYRKDKWNYANYREAYNYYLNHKSSSAVLITRKIMHFNIWGSNSAVINYGDLDFGNKGKLELADILKAQEEYNQIWLINTDNEFNIEGDAKRYIKDNFKIIETKHTNNIIRIWLWEKK